MFEAETPQVILGGKSGPMETSQLIEIVDRNKRVDGIGWRRDRTDAGLSHLCTISVGNPDLGDSRNVATPSIPEFTEFYDKANNIGIVCRGWRQLLLLFVADGWVYPSQEIERWLGAPMSAYARSLSPCR